MFCSAGSRWPTALNTWVACRGVLQLANAQQKAKQKAFLGKRVRGGNSCSSNAWYSQSLVGAIKQQGTGGLRSAGWGREKRLIQRQSKQEHSKSRQESGMETGGRKSYSGTRATGVYPQTDCIFSDCKSRKACVARACVFPPPLLILLSAVMCTFENYISLESCDSGISSTRMLMCQ